ncbi:MAG: bifunctional hydroxymethylpyrimidine kinase/phosphomethylpyrimidine kinase [Pseudomonadota bacterium]
MVSDRKPPRVLVIAGSDSSGGAGIQADIKTISALGGYAMTAITAITAQDTTGVHGIWPLPVEAVINQASVCMGDIGSDVIKTGMLAGRDLIEALAELIAEKAPAVPRVIDPVMVATSGDRLVDASTTDVLASLLMREAALVTPNAPEAEILTGKSVESVDGQRRAAEALLEAGVRAALVKGGHIDTNPIVDVLQTQHGEWLFENRRIETTSTHGTGCTLASAVATELGLGRSMNEAVAHASDYLSGAIENAPGFGQGHGPVDHAWRVERVE